MLHLLPNLIDEESDPKQVLPSYLWEVMASLQGVIVETPKAARRFFKHFCYITSLFNKLNRKHVGPIFLSKRNR